MSHRTFPAPWRVDPTEGGHFVVKDATGFSVCCVYARKGEGAAQQLFDPVVMAEQIARLAGWANWQHCLASSC
jgi:hypothetical protein